jgi:hypothetical protein
VKRGAEQRAVVVLSDAPYSGALAPVASAVGAAFFNAGPPGLAAAFEEIAAWPPPAACVEGPEYVSACGVGFTIQAPPAAVADIQPVRTDDRDELTALRTGSEIIEYDTPIQRHAHP